MAELDKVRAKSTKPPEWLTSHLEDTKTAAGIIAQRVGRLDCLTPEIAEDFWTVVEMAALLHDAGKTAEGFQDMLAKVIPRWPRRHEVASLGFVHQLVDEPLRSWVGLGVLTHHRALIADDGHDGKLTIEEAHGYETLQAFSEAIGPLHQPAAGQLLTWARSPQLPWSADNRDMPETLLPDAHRLLRELLDRWGHPLGIPEQTGLAAVLLQGAVTMADHISSAHSSLHSEQPLTTAWSKKFFAGNPPRNHQAEAASVVGHILAVGPTGSGKTELSLAWAAVQLADITERTGGIPRLFYTLPYLASINATWHRFAGGDHPIAAPDQVGVAHSRAGSFYLAASNCPEDDLDDAMKGADKAAGRAAASRLFQETIKVGTPYQLLKGALAGPVHSSVLVDTANSVFVLDELHAYDPQRLGMILAAMRMWDRLGGRIAVLSATIPKRLAGLITETLPSITHIDGKGSGIKPRHRIRTRQDQLTDPATISAIRERLTAGASVLVVANNVATAQHLYDELASTAINLHGEASAVMLHSRFKRRDRTKIEKAITSRYGSKRPHKPGLLVATQACEVSLDISLDTLFTSAAVLEALIQRFGRINRLRKHDPADVWVCEAHFAERKRNPKGVYADGVYPAEPVRSAWDILTRHDGAIVGDEDLSRWLTEIYDTAWGEAWEHKTRSKRDEFYQEFFTFTAPFQDRSRLTERFDRLFDGTEAILTQDVDAYAAALTSGTKRAGRILAEEFLIPLPHYATSLGGYNQKLGVRVIDGDYSPTRGLTRIHGKGGDLYRPGEVL